MENGNYQKTVMDSGITVMTETVSQLRSVSIGMWVLNGSVDEPLSAGGVSHFIEHLLFKGTGEHTAASIADTIDSLGGQIDAFTCREYTCYYARILDRHLWQVTDLLVDILFGSLLRQGDIEVERQVILEEIKSTEDSPEEYIHDLLTQEIWEGNPLGLPICGTNDSIRTLGRDSIIDYYRQAYQPANILVAAAGNVNHKDLVRYLERIVPFSGTPNKRDKKDLKPVQAVNHVVNKRKELEEVHVCLGTLGLHQTHPDRFAGYLLNSILGGGVSSRLFQEVREKRGLAYSIYSYYDLYSNSGLFAIYGAASGANYQEVISLILQEFKKTKNQGVSEEEIIKVKNQLKISLMLGMESTISRMSDLARNEMFFQRRIPPDETIANIERVTKEDVMRVAQEFFQTESLNLAILSSPHAPDFPVNLLQC